MSRRTLRSTRAGLWLEPVLSIPADLAGRLPPPQLQAKREHEHGLFVTVRAERSSEDVDVDRLREEVVEFLHPTHVQGAMEQQALVHSACCDNDQARIIVVNALRAAAQEDNWRELWVLLGQIQAWLTALPHMTQSAVLPWWVLHAREQAGPSGVSEVVRLDAGQRARTVKVEQQPPPLDVGAPPWTDSLLTLFARLSEDEFERVMCNLTLDEMVPISWVCQSLRRSVHRLARKPAFVDAFWSEHWQTWHAARGTSPLAIGFMLSMDPARLPPWLKEWEHSGELNWHPDNLATDGFEWDDVFDGVKDDRIRVARPVQHRADRSWPRLTADGGVDACMAELGRRGRRYCTLAAFNLDYDGELDDEYSRGFSSAVEPPRHKPVVGDVFSCELIMKLNGDGTGRIRGWPRRSSYYDKRDLGDGEFECDGYQGGDHADGKITTVRRGDEAFLNVTAEIFDSHTASSPQPCFARVRLVAPEQIFTADRTVEAKHDGTAKMKTVAGDLELCFHGSFGNVCHIMRRVAMDAEVPDPLVGEFGCVIDENPAEKWWRVEEGHDGDAADDDDDGDCGDFRSWFRRYDLEGRREGRVVFSGYDLSGWAAGYSEDDEDDEEVQGVAE